MSKRNAIPQQSERSFAGEWWAVSIRTDLMLDLAITIHAAPVEFIDIYEVIPLFRGR